MTANLCLVCLASIALGATLTIGVLVHPATFVLSVISGVGLLGGLYEIQDRLDKGNTR